MSYLNPHTHKLDGQPTVVTICGSTRFRAEMATANRDLTLAGCIVLAPGVFGHDGDEMTEQQKVDLDRLHFQKIDMADAVFVVNPGGYIGESTRREIAYARQQGKRITALVTLADKAGWTYDPANPQDCSHRDDPGHDHDQCLEQMAADRPDAPDNDEPSYPMFGTYGQKQSVLSRLPEAPDQTTGGNRGQL